MKKAIIGLLHKPLIVTSASLIIAGAIGVVALQSESANSNTVDVGADSNIAMQEAGIQAGHLSLGFLTSGRIKTVSVKVGDEVKKGDVLASLEPENTLGALTQAKAALASAQAAYQKVVNGATGPQIDVAKAAVNSAQVALEQVKRQQDVAVENARIALLNATPQAYPEDSENVEEEAPTISGSYALGKEGEIVVETYASHADSGVSFNLSGLVTGSGSVTSITPEPLGNSGLSILFPPGSRSNRTWIIRLPNTQAPDYVAKLNAYKSAVQGKTQAIATAEAAVKQAQSNLEVVAAAARPEDVAAAAAQVESARGTLQIAQAAYDSRIIRAPESGQVTAVHISAGQIAAQNVPAIELSVTSQ